MKKIFILSLCLAFSGCAASGSKTSSFSSVTPPATSIKAADTAVTKTAVTTESLMSTPEPRKDDSIVKIRIETTQGNIEADLYKAEVPKTVENFVTLAKKGFYDGIIFHRVIPQFMIQTGDPTGTGMGGPGYQFADEFNPKLRHDKPGVLSMANSGPNTNGSQFFITVVPTPWLDNRHSVFGQVTKGMDIVDQIANAPRDRQDKPTSKIAMTKVVVIEG